MTNFHNETNIKYELNNSINNSNSKKLKTINFPFTVYAAAAAAASAAAAAFIKKDLQPTPTLAELQLLFGFGGGSVF